jgi:hypothetical protein
VRAACISIFFTKRERESSWNYISASSCFCSLTYNLLCCWKWRRCTYICRIINVNWNRKRTFSYFLFSKDSFLAMIIPFPMRLECPFHFYCSFIQFVLTQTKHYHFRLCWGYCSIRIMRKTHSENMLQISFYDQPSNSKWLLLFAAGLDGSKATHGKGKLKMLFPNCM